MARLVLQVACEEDDRGMHIHIDGQDIVFDVMPIDFERNPYCGSSTRLPLKKFKSMLEKMESSEAEE